MPWTFAHPAAVLAIRPLLSARLSLAALMVGSITPDVGYYLSLFKMATFAHTLPGVITVCLPIGLLLLLLIQRLWLPIAYLLPQLVALEFSGGCFREFGEELDPARALVNWEPADDKFLKFTS